MINNKSIGFVINTNLDKTCSVIVLKKYSHPKYVKVVSKLKRLLVHDTNNNSKKGDFVLIEKTRPISKKKNWVISRILITF
jgi:small subunit ribosomal protein S17